LAKLSNTKWALLPDRGTFIEAKTVGNSRFGQWAILAIQVPSFYFVSVGYEKQDIWSDKRYGFGLFIELKSSGNA